MKITALIRSIVETACQVWHLILFIRLFICNLTLYYLIVFNVKIVAVLTWNIQPLRLQIKTINLLLYVNNHEIEICVKT